jgi:tetratricopeptide (TPR) repeat protein
LVLALLLASAASSVAQPAAECPTSECTPALATTNPVHTQLWQDAAAIHQNKIAFVTALQRFLRAQAGTFGDEGDELRTSLEAMRAALVQWDGAIQKFQAQGRAQRDAESQIALAAVWLDRHRLDAALRALAAAEQLDDGRPDLYAMRALAYGASNRPEEAVRALRRAVGLDARDATLSYWLVTRLTELNRSDEAAQVRRSLQRSLSTARRTPFARVDLLSQAPETAPIFPQGRYAAGFSALDSGEYERAVEQFADAVARDPLVSAQPAARADVVRAAAALRNGQLDVALRQLETAVSANPDQSEIHRLLGLVYWIDQQTGKSIEHVRAAIRLAPDDERARVLLSGVLASDRRLAEAERELMLASEAGLRSGQISYRLAQVYLRQSLLPRAAHAFAESDGFGPVVGRDRFYQEWGSLLVNQADFDQAVTAYARRVGVNANSAEAHRQLGEIRFLQGRDEEALTEFTVAAWLDPQDARAHAAAGQVYARQAKWLEAIAALQRALALDSTLREARYALGTVLMRSGKTEDARRELDLFARQQAEAEAGGRREFQLDALRRQASKDGLAGDHERAIARVQEAATIDANSARSHRDVGLALIRAKRFNEAIEPLTRAQRIEETAEGFVYLIDALTAAGHTDEAVRQRLLHQEFILRAKFERLRELGGR